MKIDQFPFAVSLLSCYYVSPQFPVPSPCCISPVPSPCCIFPVPSPGCIFPVTSPCSISLFPVPSPCCLSLAPSLCCISHVPSLPVAYTLLPLPMFIPCSLSLTVASSPVASLPVASTCSLHCHLSPGCLFLFSELLPHVLLFHFPSFLFPISLSYALFPLPCLPLPIPY